MQSVEPASRARKSILKRCTGVILAGGRATRYGGRPKGLERVGGRRMIDRVADVLDAATDELLLIANNPAAVDWLPGVRVARDLRTGHGSLGGIHAALVHAGEPVVVLAWDMPFVPMQLLGALRLLGEEYEAAVPMSNARHRLEPLAAFYAPSCLPVIERHLDAGERRVSALFDDLYSARVTTGIVRRFGDPSRIFMNVNSPDELALAERYATILDAAHGGDHRTEAPR